MNKYLKYFSGTLVGLMLSTSAFAAAEYAVVLKTLSNPFWVDMKKGIEDEAKTLGVSVDIFASPSEGDFQSQLQLFEDLSNKNYKGIAFAPLSSVNLVMPVARAFVIHQEIAQVTVIIKLNHFAVLTTDVDYRARCWRKKPCAQPVTGDFRHLFIGKIHQLPSVAGERQKRRCL